MLNDIMHFESIENNMKRIHRRKKENAGEETKREKPEAYHGLSLGGKKFLVVFYDEEKKHPEKKDLKFKSLNQEMEQKTSQADDRSLKVSKENLAIKVVKKKMNLKKNDSDYIEYQSGRKFSKKKKLRMVKTDSTLLQLFVFLAQLPLGLTTTCPDSTPYLHEKTSTCYSLSDCQALPATAMIVPNDGYKKYVCIKESECKLGESTKYNTEANQCVLKTHCGDNGPEEGTCIGGCYGTRPVLYQDNQCLTVNDCKAITNHYYFVAEGTCVIKTNCLIKPYSLVDEEERLCIKIEECEKLVNIKECGVNCGPNYKIIDDSEDFGFRCISSASLCSNEPSGPFYPVETSGEKLCVTAEECRSSELTLFKPGTNSCILADQCSDEVVEGRSCMPECGNSRYSSGETCIDDTACTSKTDPDTSENYETVLIGLVKKCYGPKECKDTHFWNQSPANGEKKCQSKLTCLLIDNKYLTEDDDGFFYCLNQCEDYLTSSGCVTAAICERDNLIQLLPSGGSGQKECLTKEECFSKEGYVFLKGDDSVADKCITSEECKVKLGYASLDETSAPENICLTHQECKEKSGYALLSTGSSPSSDRCVSIPLCKVTANHVYDADEGTCIPKSECLKFLNNVDEECSRICSLYSNPDETLCLSKDQCRSQQNVEYFFIETGKQKYCFNENECRNYVIPTLRRILNTDSELNYKFIIDGSSSEFSCMVKNNCEEATHYRIKSTRTCSATCDLFLTYSSTLNPSGGSECLSLEECEAREGEPTALVSTINGRPNLCLTKEQCKLTTGSLSDYLYDVSSSACIEKITCTGDKVAYEETQECFAGCIYYLKIKEGEEDKCLVETACESEVDDQYYAAPEIMISQVPLINQKYCLTREQCESTEGNFAKYFFDIRGPEDCISECDGTVIVDLSQCAADCSSGFLKGGDCYSEAGCKAFDGYFPATTTSPSCIQKSECTSGSNQGVMIFNLDSQKCVLKTTCGASDFVINGMECSATCPYYISYSSGYTSVSSTCYKIEDCSGDKFPFEPIMDGNTEVTPALCLNENDCKLTADNLDNFVWDVDESRCILKSDCDLTTKFLMEGAQECRLKCNEYLLGVEGGRDKCLTSSECSAESDSSNTYYTTPAITVDGQDQKYCLTEQACKEKDEYLFELSSQGCILKATCLSQGDTEVRGDGVCASDCSSYYVDSDTGLCYSEVGCRNLIITGDSDNRYPAEVSGGADLCVTIDECTSLGNMAFDQDEMKCVASSTCTAPRFFVTEANECHTECRKSPINTLYLMNDDSECLTANECTAKGSSFYKAQGETTNYCLTQSECESPLKEEFVFDPSPSATSPCLSKANCNANGKYVIDEIGQCKDSCPQFLTLVGNLCYSELECKNLNDDDGFSYETVQGTAGQDFCFSRADCGAHPLYMFDIDSERCILASSCSSPPRFIVQELGICTSLCENYLLDEVSGQCYTANECDALGTGSSNDLKHYKFIKEGHRSLCLTEEECKAKNGYVLNTVSQECILLTDCSSSDFYTQEAQECSSTCEHFLNYLGNSCYTEAECEAYTYGGTHYPAVGPNQQFCITQAQCESEGKADYVFDVEDNECISIQACSLKEGKYKQMSTGRCATGCTGYLSSDESICYTQSECEALGSTGEFKTYEVAGDTNYCFSEASCKAKEGYVYNTDTFQCVRKSDCGGYVIEDQNECVSSCNGFLNSSGDECLSENDCLSQGDNYRVVTFEGEDQKLCLTIEECGTRIDLLYDIQGDTCVRPGKCTYERGKYMLSTRGHCTSECFKNKFYLDVTGRACYAQSQCLQRNLLLTKVEDENEKNRCFTEPQCLISNLGDFYVMRTQPWPTCVTRDQCLEAGWVTIGRECIEKCPNDQKMVKNGVCEVICDEGQFALLGSYVCTLGSAEEACGILERPIKRVSGKYKIYKLSVIGERSSRVCFAHLSSSIPAMSLETPGEVKQGAYDVEKTSDGRIIARPNKDLRTLEIPGLVEERERLIQEGMANPFFIRIFVYDSVPTLSDSEKMSGIRSIVLRFVPQSKRYLQEGGSGEEEVQYEERRMEGEGYQTVTDQQQGETYAAFDSPGGQEFEATINFNENSQFNIVKNGLDNLFRLGINQIEYQIPATESTRPEPPVDSEPTDILGYLTLGIDIYLRVIAPFVPIVVNSALSIQALLSQNYQRLVMISYFSYGVGDHNDWLYLKTFKDWLGHFSNTLIGEPIVQREIDYHCFMERKRRCIFGINNDILVVGTISIFLFVFFNVFGYLGALIVKDSVEKEREKLEKKRKKSRNKKKKKSIEETNLEYYKKDYAFGRYAAYKVYPSAILGLQPLFIFYLINTMANNNQAEDIFVASRYLSIMIFVGIISNIVMMCIYGTKLYMHTSRIFDESFTKVFNLEKVWNVKVYLMASFFYDIFFSTLSAVFSTDKFTQVAGFIFIEAMFLLILSKYDPFLNPRITKLFKIRRGMFIVQGVFMLICSGLGNSEGLAKAMEMIIFIISWVHIALSVVILYVSKKKIGLSKDRQNNYKSTDVKEKNALNPNEQETNKDKNVVEIKPHEDLEGSPEDEEKKDKKKKKKDKKKKKKKKDKKKKKKKKGKTNKNVNDDEKDEGEMKEKNEGERKEKNEDEKKEKKYEKMEEEDLVEVDKVDLVIEEPYRIQDDEEDMGAIKKMNTLKSKIQTKKSILSKRSGFRGMDNDKKDMEDGFGQRKD